MKNKILFISLFLFGCGNQSISFDTIMQRIREQGVPEDSFDASVQYESPTFYVIRNNSFSNFNERFLKDGSRNLNE